MTLGSWLLILTHMTFEEFFKKKRIDLAALSQAEPVLFSEFEQHFKQMGEKSFDHTKKYWFNKLRIQYHLAPEIKPEKPKAENQLAEQTVTEELSEMAAAPKPKVGFTPRFKAAAPAKPVEETPAPVEEKPTVTEGEKPKGFTPRFKAGVTKPAESVASATSEEKAKEAPATEDKPKIGFTPRFKAGVTKPAETVSEEKAPESKPGEEVPTASEEKPKMGFTPRFKAGVTKTVENPEVPKSEEPVSSEEKPTEEKPKMGFTPRFKAGVTKITSADQSKTEEAAASEGKPEQSGEKPSEEKPKMGFTPRFKAGITKQAPPPAEE